MSLSLIAYPIHTALCHIWASRFVNYYTVDILGTSGGVMVGKLDKKTYTNEFESHWVPHLYGLVPHLCKKLNKLRLETYLRAKKLVEHESDGETICIWCAWNNPLWLRKGTGRIGNQTKNRDHPDYSRVEIGQITEKSPGDLRRLDVAQTPVKDHHY